MPEIDNEPNTNQETLNTAPQAETSDAPTSTLKLRPREESAEEKRLWDQIKAQPIDQDLLVNFIKNYFPDEIDEETAKLYLHTLLFIFAKQKLKSEEWVRGGESTIRELIETNNVNKSSSLVDKLRLLTLLREDARSNAAFGGLEWMEKAFVIEGLPTIKEEVSARIANNAKCDVWDIGAGAQAFDIELITTMNIPNLHITGVGLADEGKTIREIFEPETKGQIDFVSNDVLWPQFPKNEADMVVSERTFRYLSIRDAKTFLSNLHSLTREGGSVRVSDIPEDAFRFEGTRFESFRSYLDYLQKEKGFTNLKYKREGHNYSIYWKNDGRFPFAELKPYFQIISGKVTRVLYSVTEALE